MIELNLIVFIDTGCTFNIIRKYLYPEDYRQKLEEMDGSKMEFEERLFTFSLSCL